MNAVDDYQLGGSVEPTPIPIFDDDVFLFDERAPLSFASAMGDGAAGALVVRFADNEDHTRNRERASAMLSTLGRLVCAVPSDGLWSDLAVRLDADPGRTHGIGENPFHMDLVDRHRAPRYIALYCERDDPAGGGASRLADVWAALDGLGETAASPLTAEAYSYFTDSGVYGVGAHLKRFRIVPLDLAPGVPVRYTSKMLPHVKSGELVDSTVVSIDAAVEAFEGLSAAVSAQSVEHHLKPGEMLVFDQYRFAHARAPLGPDQESLPSSSTRLLRQTYVSDGD